MLDNGIPDLRVKMGTPCGFQGGPSSSKKISPAAMVAYLHDLKWSRPTVPNPLQIRTE